MSGTGVKEGTGTPAANGTNEPGLCHGQAPVGQVDNLFSLHVGERPAALEDAGLAKLLNELQHFLDTDQVAGLAMVMVFRGELYTTADGQERSAYDGYAVSWAHLETADAAKESMRSGLMDLQTNLAQAAVVTFVPES